MLADVVRVGLGAVPVVLSSNEKGCFFAFPSPKIQSANGEIAPKGSKTLYTGSNIIANKPIIVRFLSGKVLAPLDGKRGASSSLIINRDLELVSRFDKGHLCFGG